MRYRKIYWCILITILPFFSFAQRSGLSDYERNCETLFKHFMNFISNDTAFSSITTYGDSASLANPKWVHDQDSVSIQMKADQTNRIKHIIARYVVIRENGLDNLQEEILKRFSISYYTFSSFLQTRYKGKFSDLKLIPLRLFDEKSIHSNMDPELQKNCFVVVDKNNPPKPIWFLLFAPEGAMYKGSKISIISWTLVFDFGQYHFRDVYGDLGTDIFILKGV